MQTVIRNVADIDAHDRQALERVVGQPLSDTQQLVISVVSHHTEAAATTQATAQDQNGLAVLPAWCNVYAGLSDEEIADLEKIVLTRADLTRPAE